MRDDNETIDVTDGGKQQFGMELTFLVQTKIFLQAGPSGRIVGWVDFDL